MEPDFYLDQRALAGYFEKDWFDHVVATKSLPASFFEFTPFDPSLLYSDGHETVADFLSRTLTRVGIAPRRLLEVGSALGRGFYEICQRTPSLQSATLVEPSQSLAGTFERLFRSPDVHRYPVLKGNTEMAEVAFDSTHLQEAVRHLDLSLINSPYELLGEDLGVFDLVVCFNVLDQCRAPLILVDLLKTYTAPGGILALSCTYQWSEKHLGTAETPTRDINGLFRDGWTRLNETNIEFKFRKGERHWHLFLSQVLVFRKS